jgi:hypothetical protein
MTHRSSLLLLFCGLLLAQQLDLTSADFGDFADTSFVCPATTTCPVVCVAALTDCPAELICASDETLCPNGSCVARTSAASCPDDWHNRNPCKNDCAPMACAKIDALLDTCYEDYGEQYLFEEDCAAETKDDRTAVHVPAMAIFYIWLSIITIAMLVWCRFNNTRIAGATGNASDAQRTKAFLDDNATGDQFQVGYRKHSVGRFLHFCIIGSLLVFQAKLLFFAIESYFYHDQAQVLLAFEITWVVAFFWTFSLKWPHSIGLIFLRRCQLHEATHVAVQFEEKQAKEPETNMHRRFERAAGSVNAVMRWVFSDVPQNVTLCPVALDELLTRHFNFNFRRYNFDPEAFKFVPGVFQVAETVADVVTASKGLGAEDVESRRRIVGDNSIEMAKPVLLEIIIKEFSKPFYTYQLFMLWTWTPLVRPNTSLRRVSQYTQYLYTYTCMLTPNYFLLLVVAFYSSTELLLHGSCSRKCHFYGRIGGGQFSVP